MPDETQPPIAPGGADEWWEAAECEAWAQARQHASEIGWRDLDKAESIAAAATGSLRFAILAAVRRAAEQGRRDGISECVAAMRSYVAESEQIAANHRGNSDIAVAFQDKADALDAASNRLAALADDEGRGT